MVLKAAVSVVWPVVFVILVVWSLEGVCDIGAWVLSWGAQWSSNWNASVGAGSIRGAVRAVMVNFVSIWRAEGTVGGCEAQELGFPLHMLQLLEKAMVRHVAWHRDRLALEIAVHAVYTYKLHSTGENHNNFSGGGRMALSERMKE